MGGIFFVISQVGTAVTKNLRKVLPDDYDKETLWAAVQEGRVYIDESQKVRKEDIKKEVRKYVQQLKPLVTNRFANHVDDIWEKIFACDELMKLLMPSAKARKFKAFNKYNVMRIIGVLREAGVYEPHNDRVYIARLEHTDKDNSYRCYIGKGIEQHPLQMELTKLTNKPYKSSGISQKPEKQ